MNYRDYNNIPLEYYTDVRTIPVGTKFYVYNGDWHGEIILIGNIKYIRNIKGNFIINPNRKHLLLIDIKENN